MSSDNRDFQQILVQYPNIQQLKEQQYVFWLNPNLQREQPVQPNVSMDLVEKAQERLQRFSSYIKVAFPETAVTDGIIESGVRDIPAMKKLIEGRRGIEIPGRFMLKCDQSLPVARSIKARGGIYEVLAHAERLAITAGLLTEQDDYAKLANEAFRTFFSQYKIAVGSTGNLGLSIGIIGAKLGFDVTVHMSADAKEWKKELLREKGVTVVEYAEDYSAAVAAGRQRAAEDAMCHFVDDENSLDLFVGYAVAALRVEGQLRDANIKVDGDHPLFVYLPCGVGGGPGGVAYGLKQIYGEHVHIFFGEPMQSPCMLLGMMTGLHDEISVADIGLTNETEADGLAVGRASKFVGTVMEPILSGCYTVDDAFLFRSLKAMLEQENIFMEPSAHAGVYGPIELMNRGYDYIKQHGLADKMEQAVHLIWSTGGDLVPEAMRQHYLQIEK